MLTCQCLTHEAEIESLAPSWRALHQKHGATPFTDFDWVWAWAQSVGKPSGATLLVIACFDGAALVGLLPFAIERKYTARVLRYAGHDAFYLRTLLAETPEVTRALWAALRQSNLYDYANIKNLHEGTEELRLLESFATCIGREPVYYREHQGLTRTTLYQAYTRRFRAKLHKIGETMEAQSDMTFGMSADGSLLDEAIPFLVKEKSDWCQHNGKKGLFESPHAEAFYKALSQVGVKQGVMRLFWLRRGGKLAGVLLCFITKDALYAHTVAYAPAVRSLHPGLFLASAAMIWAAEAGLNETNFMEGQEFFKTRFATASRLAAEFGYARTLKGHLFFAAWRARELYRRLRQRSEKA